MAVTATAGEPALRMEANVMIEIPLRADRTYADPFKEITRP